MRAIRVHEHGDGNALQLEDLPVPEPKPGEVRIKVAWSALNHLDTWVRRGVPGHKFPLPLIPGCDFSGIIDACGKQVEAWEVGGLRVVLALIFGIFTIFFVFKITSVKIFYLFSINSFFYYYISLFKK